MATSFRIAGVSRRAASPSYKIPDETNRTISRTVAKNHRILFK